MENSMTQLRSVTSHKGSGSHSVTCYLTPLNTLRLVPSQTGWYLIYRPFKDGGLSKPRPRVQRATGPRMQEVKEKMRRKAIFPARSSQPLRVQLWWVLMPLLLAYPLIFSLLTVLSKRTTRYCYYYSHPSIGYYSFRTCIEPQIHHLLIK